MNASLNCRLSLLAFAVVLALFPTRAFAEDEVEAELPRDEASLAIDPPDAPTTDAAEQLEDSDIKDQEDLTRNINEAEVPNIDEDTYAAREGSEQIKLLKYHRQIVSDRERTRASGLEEAPHTFHFSLGANIAMFGGPPGAGVDFQVTLSDHFSLGPTVTLFGYTSTGTVLGRPFVGDVSIPGAGLAFNYYSRKPYEGIWVQLGSGMDSFRAGSLSADTISNEVPIFFNIGWRFLNDANNLTFAFGAGGRGYFFATTPAFVFAIKLEVGLAWNIFPH